MKKEKIGKKIMEKKSKEKGKKISDTKKSIKKEAKIKIRSDIIDEIEKNQKKCPFVIKNVGGAPTKFEERFTQEMLSFFQNHIKDGYFENYTEEQVAGKDAKIVKIIKQRAKSIPMFEKYALSIGVDSKTLLNRAIAKDEKGKLLHRGFFLSYKQCLDIQLTMLKELGMNGQYVSNIVKLLLSAEHGIYDIKEDNDQTEKGKQLEQINSTNIDDSLQDVLTKS